MKNFPRMISKVISFESFALDDFKFRATKVVEFNRRCKKNHYALAILCEAGLIILLHQMEYYFRVRGY